MKKTVKQILILLGLCLVFVSIFSCNDIIGLGEKLDINGPVVTITAPPARKPVNATFTLEGTVTDLTGVDILLVKAVVNNQEIARQWRYNGGWQITDNRGGAWASYSSANTTWQGDAKSAVWKLDIDFQGVPGEYTIIVQAWDTGGFTDENSYKSRVIIVDNDLPKINITDPYLYYEYSTADKKPTDGEFPTLEGYSNTDKARFDPSLIGKFITRGFNLQYQIDDDHDVWSIEIRLYDDSVTVDEDATTTLPDGYIFSFKDNEGPPPDQVTPAGSIKPSGKIVVPALDSSDPSIKKRITEKSTIKIVGLCYDAAGNVNQEKILGYFFYWALADKPWVTFAEGILKPGNVPIINGGYPTKDAVYTIYPGREIKSIAYHAHGLLKVEYSIYKWTDWNSGRDASPTRPLTTVLNDPRFGDTHSTIFSWSFLPPTSTGFYSVTGKAYGEGEVESEDFEYMFFVQDASFPDFVEEPNPSASLPLYQSIGVADEFGNATGTNKIRIHGLVSDATDISSVYLVWINPESREYAAMSQLSYFRDSEYVGWKKADAITTPPAINALTNFREETEYDPDHPNKVWRVPITKRPGKDVNDRIVYEYSQLIDLTDQLNIAGSAVGKDRPLRSQTFLLRVRNPDGKCTIITYAPQGDESAPIIPVQTGVDDGKSINFQIKVTVTSSSNAVLKNCYSGNYALIEQFEAGQKITVEGRWEEDSTEYLNFETYLKNNIDITINGYKIDGNQNTTLTYTPASGKATAGTWKAEAVLGTAAQSATHKLLANNVKDTLVTSIVIKDIGGNITEAGGSWLIRSDTLRLLRISSEMADTKYNASSTPIKIFLEFNKPVELVNPANVPSLQLNVTGGADTSRRATYSSGQTSKQSTKQYFDYTVIAGHATSDPVLDVTSLVGNYTGSYWTAANYAFYWKSGSGNDIEYIKITLPASGHASGMDKESTAANAAYLRRLPVYSQSVDQVYSFRGGKNIEIDTTAPTVTQIESTNPAGFYTTGADIFIEATFSEAVKISGTPPALQFSIKNGTTDVTRTQSTTGTVKVNGNKISFTYKVQAFDTTSGDAIVITNFTPAGSITDIAGNPLSATGISGASAAIRTLNGTADSAKIGIEANNPTVPIVKIKTAAANTNGNTTTNVVSNNVNNATVNGFSTGTGYTAWTGAGPAAVALSNLYNDTLWIAIDGNTSKGAHTLNALEYSINNGVDWVRAPSITSNSFVLEMPRPGSYQITARQIDRAGNVSNWAQPITLNWDPGTLVTNITSTSANGTYTHNTDRNSINIRVNFRKPLVFTTTPTLTLNARTSANAFITLPADGSQTGALRSYLDYTYTVASGHNIASNANLAVSGFSTGFTVRDSTTLAVAVEVSSHIRLPSGDALLQNNKEIKIDTSPLNITAGPVFEGGTTQADGSWTGTLRITFNNNVAKGEGNIRIEQILGTAAASYYRLPAVLTEAQYNKLRGVANIDSFYTKGTNGYLTSTSESDTSTKYILEYSNDTANITPNGSAANGTIAKLADDMRKAEAVEININAQAVTISGNVLTVTLTGSNALQVAGASYAVTYGNGLVQDSLGNILTERNSTTGIATTGVARPYIRIQKSQDTITTQSGSASAPIYAATQPLTSQARMDCRTPGASVVYRYLETRTNVSALNWQQTGPDDSLSTGNPDPSQLGDPSSNTTGNYGTFTTNSPITLPITTGDRTTYQGYQCLIRAVGRTGNTGNYSYSANSEEIAYRTVLTYRIRDMRNESGSWGQNMTTTPATGAQVWIRGGDAIGSSTTPGFPLTWADDWYALSGKRAGIRLLTMTEYSTNMNTSIWKFVTWEINVPAYFDMIKGNNLTNSSNDAAVTWQYGPREWAYQRAGWTSFKEQYPMFPGKHRWLYVDGSDSFASKGQVNFAGTFSARRTFTATEGWTSPNTANAKPSN